jgi:DNA-binding NarL/FixJ family response regulator
MAQQPPDPQGPHRSPHKAVGVIESTPGFEHVGEATSGERAIALAASLRPDLVLIDVRMPGLGGLAAARCITMARSASAVVLVSSDPQDVSADAAAGCGAVALISKQHLRPTSLTELWKRCAVRP